MTTQPQGTPAEVSSPVLPLFGELPQVQQIRLRKMLDVFCRGNVPYAVARRDCLEMFVREQQPDLIVAFWAREGFTEVSPQELKALEALVGWLDDVLNELREAEFIGVTAEGWLAYGPRWPR